MRGQVLEAFGAWLRLSEGQALGVIGQVRGTGEGCCGQERRVYVCVCVSVCVCKVGVGGSVSEGGGLMTHTGSFSR